MAVAAKKTNAKAVVNNDRATSLLAIDNIIHSIRTKGQALRDEAHKGLIMVIDHYIAHGDGYTDKLKELHGAVRDFVGSSMGAALLQWVAENVTSLKWDDKAKGGAWFVHVPKVEKKIRDLIIKDEQGKVVFEGNAREYPFYKLERPVRQTPFDMTKAFKALVDRATKALEANYGDNPAHNLVTKAQLEAIQDLGRRMSALGKVTDDVYAPAVAANENEGDEKTIEGEVVKAAVNA